MATAKDKFKDADQKVRNARKDLDVQVPATTGNIQKVENAAVPTTVVDKSQPLATDINVPTTSAIAQNLTGIYDAANTALEDAGNKAIASFSSVTDRLNQILAPGVTVDQLRQTIGGFSWDERNAQLAVLTEIENAQAVELKKLDVQETQVGIELKRIAIQLKAAKGFIKNAITVEEIKDYENQLATVQEQNRLKQDGRNIQLSFLAGKNAVDQSRVAGRLNFLASVDQRRGIQENDKLDHIDAISALHRRLYAATQKGYAAYVEGKEASAAAKASLADRMKNAAKGEKSA